VAKHWARGNLAFSGDVGGGFCPPGLGHGHGQFAARVRADSIWSTGQGKDEKRAQEQKQERPIARIDFLLQKAKHPLHRGLRPKTASWTGSRSLVGGPQSRSGCLGTEPATTGANDVRKRSQDDHNEGPMPGVFAARSNPPTHRAWTKPAEVAQACPGGGYVAVLKNPTISNVRHHEMGHGSDR